ncbi:jg11526 [Pararge aegeria aegeria]|uniref:Jg11525 protein n=1 Tax=Pararge aegeria aegeria TaxID=348720 RepID=A0A8S4RNA6_9NEOP|nr:jg11525 [Pararge aegeria aegeria]CAH2238247.1 jg11526 [Pararge aegeria aegeria]
MSHTVGGVTTLRAARAGARARVYEHAASGATERGRRCSERNSLRAPAPPPSAPPRSPAPCSRTHQNDEFIFRACWPSYPRTLPRVPQRPHQKT